MLYQNLANIKKGRRTELECTNLENPLVHDNDKHVESPPLQNCHNSSQLSETHRERTSFVHGILDVLRSANNEHHLYPKICKARRGIL